MEDFYRSYKSHHSFSLLQVAVSHEENFGDKMQWWECCFSYDIQESAAEVVFCLGDRKLLPIFVAITPQYLFTVSCYSKQIFFKFRKTFLLKNRNGSQINKIPKF